MSNNDELDRIASRVEELCRAALLSGRPYFVSALGIDLGEDLQRIKAETGGTLADFLRGRLSSKYELVRRGEHANVLAIIPVGGESLAASEFVKGRERFHYRLWAAFSVPPTSGARYLKMSDLTFEDLPAESPQPEGTLPISIDLVPPADHLQRDETIWQNLTKWLSDNGLEREEFLASERRASKSVNSVRAEGLSLLELVLNSLDRRQLQSTQMSLDVVATLHNSRNFYR
jgi:hypothetical protein